MHSEMIHNTIKTTLLIAFLSVILALTGCKKCATCFREGVCTECKDIREIFPDFTICKSDFASESDYLDLVYFYNENDDYKCKELKAVKDELESCSAEVINKLRLEENYRCVY